MAGAAEKLFKNASREIRRQAEQEFYRSDIGKMVKMSKQMFGRVDRASRKGKRVTKTGSRKRMAKEFWKKIEKMSRSGTLKRMAAQSLLGEAAGLVEAGRRVSTYAKKGVMEEGGIADSLMTEFFSALGPFGGLMESLIRPTAGRMAESVAQELGVASSLIRAFGGFAVMPGDRDRNEDMIAYLEEQGYTVTRPVKSDLDIPTSATRFIPPLASGKPRKTIDVEVSGKRKRFKVNDPVVTGEMILVSSSNVHSIGFDMKPGEGTLGTMKVRFLQDKGQAAGPLYYYFNVPTTLFLGFQKTRSKGEWVWDNLRVRGTVSGHRYDYKLAGITDGYVPRKATVGAGGEFFIRRQFSGRSTVTGKEKIFESGPDMFVRQLGGKPGQFTQRGAPNRAAPNRGKPQTGRLGGR